MFYIFWEKLTLQRILIKKKSSQLSKNMEQICTKTPAQENEAYFLSNSYAFIKQKDTTYVICYTMDNEEIRRSNH